MDLDYFGERSTKLIDWIRDQRTEVSEYKIYKIKGKYPFAFILWTENRV